MMIESQLSDGAVSWQEDYAKRVNPELMTGLLHDAIPVLKATGWRVTEVQEGACTSELPLCFESTNQHGTHQAALISLSADYTGGLALATLLRGVPLAGVHRCKDEQSASLWLASMDVKYRSPSTGHLRARCEVPSKVARTVRQRYFAGKRVLVSLPVTFTSNDEVVAEAEMKYFAQPSIQLQPTREKPKISPLYKHKLRASARMIAGLRASNSDDARTRIDHGHDDQAAGPHGRLLASRLQGALPQLKDMVLARTKHIDETLIGMRGLRQVVLLGVGLDMRPFRMHERLGEPMFFELDLAEMLEERSRVIAQMNAGHAIQRRMVAIDFKQDDVAECLLKHPEFDASLPTAFIYEGCSMYFDAEQNRQVLMSVRRAMGHTDSRLWCDLVSEAVVEGTTMIPEIAKFLAGMEALGEKFIFGVNHPADLLAQCGFSGSSVISAQQYLNNDDRAFSTYRFAVAES